MESVRVADCAVHHIVVRTRYEIEVDGRMLMGHMGVTYNGSVHYHPVSNVAWIFPRFRRHTTPILECNRPTPSRPPGAIVQVGE